MSEHAPTRPAPTPTAADDIFLSPRVVDRQAFAEFAAQLRGLIDQSGAQADALRQAAEDAQRTRDGLHDAVNANQMKLDMATRALATIDQKAEQTRKMIEGASNIATRIDEFRAQADQVISERIGILCQRLNEAEEAAVAQVESLHARLAQAEERAAEREASLVRVIESLTGERVQRLESLVARAEAIVHADQGLAAMIERADEAGRAAIRATSELSSIRAQADQARQILAQSLYAAVPIIDDATSVHESLERAVGEAVRFARTASESLGAEAEGHRQRVRAEADVVTPRVEGAARCLADALRSTEAASSDARSTIDAAREAAARLESLLHEVTPWRRVLLGDSDDAPVGAALNGMVVELKKELRGVAGALRSLAKRTENALEPEPAA